jgi:hypothetical protein
MTTILFFLRLTFSAILELFLLHPTMQEAHDFEVGYDNLWDESKHQHRDKLKVVRRQHPRFTHVQGRLADWADDYAESYQWRMRSAIWFSDSYGPVFTFAHSQSPDGMENGEIGTPSKPPPLFVKHMPHSLKDVWPFIANDWRTAAAATRTSILGEGGSFMGVKMVPANDMAPEYRVGFDVRSGSDGRHLQLTH